MSNDQDAWMPLWIGSYMADTGRFTTEQHGAYLLIIMDYWRNGPPPDDDDTLATIAKTTASNWRRMGPTVRAKFKSVDGLMRHKRIDHELALAKERADAAAAKARKAAEARWKDKPKQCSKHAPSIPQGEAKDVLEECPTPSPINTSVPNGTGGKPPGLSPKDYVFSQGVPMLVAAGCSDKNARSMLAGLLKASGDDEVAKAVAECAAEQPIQPVSWLQARLRAKAAARLGARPGAAVNKYAGASAAIWEDEVTSG